jgi:hypothetical protein
MTRGAGVYLEVLSPVVSHERNSHGSDMPWRVSHRLFFIGRSVYSVRTSLGMLWLLPTLERLDGQGAVSPSSSTLHGGLLAFTLAHPSFEQVLKPLAALLFGEQRNFL